MNTGDNKPEVLLPLYRGSSDWGCDEVGRPPEEHVEYLRKCAADWRSWPGDKMANETQAKIVDAAADRLAALIRITKKEVQ